MTTRQMLYEATRKELAKASIVVLSAADQLCGVNSEQQLAQVRNGLEAGLGVLLRAYERLAEGHQPAPLARALGLQPLPYMEAVEPDPFAEVPF